MKEALIIWIWDKPKYGQCWNIGNCQIAIECGKDLVIMPDFEGVNNETSTERCYC